MSPSTKKWLLISVAVVAAAILTLLLQRWMGSTTPVSSPPSDPTGALSSSAATLPQALGVQHASYETHPEQQDREMKELAQATFAGGCFWCTEAVFREIEGVESVVSGYSNGTTENPTYEQICTGTTGHAEVIRISYDPQKVRYEELLEIFFMTHDPTTLNRQGGDVGTQYRSAIFFHNDEQKTIAEEVKKQLDQSEAFANKIVTEITKAEKFYPAEDYHQDYFAENEFRNPYCSAVIRPKIDKLRKVFADKLKKDKAEAK